MLNGNVTIAERLYGPRCNPVAHETHASCDSCAPVLVGGWPIELLLDPEPEAISGRCEKCQLESDELLPIDCGCGRCDGTPWACPACRCIPGSITEVGQFFEWYLARREHHS